MQLGLSDPRARHIVKVLRSRPGDRILIGEIDGCSGYALVESIDTKQVCLRCDLSIPPKPLYPVELITAQVRPICMKRILREAVSLGVRKIHVCGADTAEKSYRDAHLWTRGEYTEYLLHGAQQAVSTLIPELQLYDRVDDIRLPTSMHALLLDNVSPDHSIMSTSFEGVDSCAVAIGPERGWSDRERALFRERGFTSVGMGSRVLRTETACSAALALVLGRMGLL